MGHSLDGIGAEIMALLRSAERLNLWPSLQLDFSESGGISITEGKHELIAALNRVSVPDGTILRGIELLQEAKIPFCALRELSAAVSEVATELDAAELPRRSRVRIEPVKRARGGQL